MLELMVVMVIIAVLASMAFVSVGLLQKKARRVETSNLMSQLTAALTSYLEKWPTLGDKKPDDFRASPWSYLYSRPKSAGLGPFIELQLTRLIQAKGGNCSRVELANKATHIVDYFGNSSDNIISFAIFEGTAGTTRFAKAIEMRSSTGTPDKPKDDILYRYVSALSEATPSSEPGDAGKFVQVSKILGPWNDPLDAKMQDLDDPKLKSKIP